MTRVHTTWNAIEMLISFNVFLCVYTVRVYNCCSGLNSTKYTGRKQQRRKKNANTVSLSPFHCIVGVFVYVQLAQPIPFSPGNIFILPGKKVHTHTHEHSETNWKSTIFIDRRKGTRKTNRQYDNSNNIEPKIVNHLNLLHILYKMPSARSLASLIHSYRAHILFTLSFVLSHFNANQYK